MPLCTIHLISLDPSTSVPSFLSSLSSQSPPLKPLVASRVVRWIITPTTIDANDLLHPPYPWTLLLILLGTPPLPSGIRTNIRNIYTVTAGVPSRLLGPDFQSKNDSLLHPDGQVLESDSTLPDSRSSSALPQDSQKLTLSPDLVEWARSFSNTPIGSSPLSMLNLLAFHKTESAKKSYQAYGAAFAKSIGSRHGGNAKIVGNVVHDEASKKMDRDQSEFPSAAMRPASGSSTTTTGKDDTGHPDQSEFPSASVPANTNPGGWKWDEMALAQYPSKSIQCRGPVVSLLTRGTIRHITLCIHAGQRGLPRSQSEVPGAFAAGYFDSVHERDRCGEGD